MALKGRTLTAQETDEIGLVSAKTYPGEVWKESPGRATFAPDYGRRGRVWFFGRVRAGCGPCHHAV
jgi:hypothetical protein